jgi:cobalamin biosynthesis protein CbiD
VAGHISEAQAQTVTAQPNIVFILTDDMRKDDMKRRAEGMRRVVLVLASMALAILLAGGVAQAPHHRRDVRQDHGRQPHKGQGRIFVLRGFGRTAVRT